MNTLNSTLIISVDIDKNIQQCDFKNQAYNMLLRFWHCKENVLELLTFSLDNFLEKKQIELVLQYQ